jgi:hypothetical protein
MFVHLFIQAFFITSQTKTSKLRRCFCTCCRLDLKQANLTIVWLLGLLVSDLTNKCTKHLLNALEVMLDYSLALCSYSLKSVTDFSPDLSLVTIKFWLLNTLSQLQVYSGKGLLVSDLTNKCTKHLLNLDVLVWLFAFSCYTIHTSLKNDIYQCIG